MKKLFLYLAFLVLFVGCSKENIFSPETFCQEEAGDVVIPDMSNVDVSARDHKVFANLKSNPSASSTKASGNAPEELESLLDRSKTMSLVIGTKTLIEVPFKDEYSNEAANLTLFAPDSFNADSLSFIKMSLLDWYDNETEEHSISVVTMIPYPDSYSLDLGAEYSFTKAICQFRGILLFSDIDGTYIGSYEYLEGKLTELVVFDPSGIDDNGAGNVAFISFPTGNSGAGTKANTTVTVQHAEGCDVYMAFAEELDAAVCVAEKGTSASKITIIYMPTQRSNGIEDLIDYTYNNRTYGGGGGGASSGAKTSINKENIDGTPEHVNNLLPKLKGESNYISAVKDALKKYSNTNPLMNHIVSLLDKYSDRLKEIEIKKVVTYNGTSVTGLTTPLGDGKYKVEIREDDIEANPLGVNLPALLEELLHVVQYCEDPNWTTGDMELEAKVMVSLFHEQTDLSSGLSKEFREIFKSYYNNPNDDTYAAAVRTLRQYPLSYPESKFPITPNRSHKERLKHIILN